MSHAKLSRRTLLHLLGASALLPGAAHAGLDGYRAGSPQTFTLSGATLLRHDGTLLRGAGIRVEDGVIMELGPGVTGGVSLDGDWLVPGFTDAGCAVGLVEVGLEKATHDQSEPTEASTPDARVVDGYNPLSTVVPITRVAGITSVLVQPAADHLITGQAALLATAGLSVAEATLLAPAGLCINLGRAGTSDKGPRSRMGVAMRLREILDGVKLPPEVPEKKRRKAEPPGDGDLKPAERALRALRQGRLLALVQADRVDDLLGALELIRHYKLKAVLLGGAEGHLIADALAQSGLPLLLDPTTQPSSFDHPHARYENAAILHRAGVKLAFRSRSAHGSRQLPTLVSVAVAHGLPHEAAIAGLTHVPGDIFGLSGLGRMEEGAAATFFRSTGDPLQARSRVTQVWIQGRETDMTTHQSQLYERYRRLR